MNNQTKDRARKTAKQAVIGIAGLFFLLSFTHAAFATTVNLGSDFVCNSLALTNTGNLSLKGYDMNVGGVTFNAAGGALDASQAGGPNATLINVSGHWDNTAAGIFTADTSTVTLNGAANQNLITGGRTFNALTLNNTGAGGSDNITLTGNLTVNSLLTITDGKLVQGSANIQAGGVTVDANGTWSNTSTGDVTLTGNVSNAGSITFDSSDDAGNGITVTSNSTTPRNWQGAGTFSLADVAVSYMTCTGGTPASISTISSSNAGNNDANWLFPGLVGYLKVTASGASLTAGGNLELTVTAYDNTNAVVTTYTGDKSLTFSGLNNAPDGSAPKVEGVNLGSALTVAFTNGTSNANAATLVAYKAEALSLDVSDSTYSTVGNDTYDIDLAILHAAADYLAVTAPAGPQVAGASFNLTNVKAYDRYGNLADGANSAPAYSGSKTLTYTFSGVANGPDSGTDSYTTAVSFTAGASTTALATLLHRAQSSVTISADDAALANIVANTASAAFHIRHAATDHLKFSAAVSSPKTAGTGFNLPSLNAVDAFGNLADGANGATVYTGSKTVAYVLSGTANGPDSGTDSYTTAVSFATGASTTALATTLHRAQSTTITANAVDLDGTDVTSNSFTVNVEAANKLKFSVNPPASVASGATWSSFSVSICDTYGNARGTGTDTINLSENGAGSFGGTTSKAAADGVATFDNITYAVAESINVTAGATGLTSTSAYSVSVTSGSVSYLKVTSGSASMNTGGTLELTITAYDSNNNVVTGYSGNKSLTFSGLTNGPEGNIPTVEGINQGSAVTVGFTNGASNTNAATLVAYKVESSVAVDVTDGTNNSTGNTSYDLDLTVNVGNANKLKFSVNPPASVTTGSTWASFSVSIYDLYGNARGSGTDTISLSENGAGSFGGTASKAATNGVAVFNDISYDTAGSFNVTAGATGLTSTPGFAVTAGSSNLTNTGVTLGSTQANQFTNMSVSFRLASALPTTGKIKIILDADFGLGNIDATDVFIPSLDGALSVSTASGSITITRGSGATEKAANSDITVNIYDIRTPATSQTTSDYTLQTLTTTNTVLNTGTVSGSVIGGAGLQGAFVDLDSKIAGVTTTLHFNFAINTALDVNDKIKLKLDPDFDVTGASGTIETNSVSGGITTTVVNGATEDTITFIRNSAGTSMAAGSFVAIQVNIKNPANVGFTDAFTISTLDTSNTDAVMDTVTVPGQNISSADALSNVFASLANPAVNATTKLDIDFMTPQVWPSNGKVVITVGNTFVLSAVTASSGTGRQGTVTGSFTTSVSGSAITLTRQYGLDIPAGSFIALSVNNITTPASAGQTGAFTVQLQQSNGTAISSGTAPGVNISQNVMASASVTLGSTQMGQTTTARVTFSAAADPSDLPSNGKISIMFDWRFNLAGVNNATVVDNTLDGTISTAVNGNMVTLTRSGGTDKAGTVTVLINGVQNPFEATTTTPYFISILQSNNSFIASSVAEGSRIGVVGVQWVGGGDNLWSTNANWSTGAQPTAADDVVINCAMPNCPTLTENALVKSLHLGQTSLSLLTLRANLSASNEIIIYGMPTYNPFGGTNYFDFHNFAFGSKIIVQGILTGANSINGGTAQEPRGAGYTITAPTIKIFEGGAIDASGQGFLAKQTSDQANYWGGSGYPQYDCSSNGISQWPGASHAGTGGFAGGCFPPQVYMNANPTELGSAGRSIFSPSTMKGGPGGGAVKVITKDLQIFNGSIEANGRSGMDTSNNCNYGCGANTTVSTSGGGGGSGGSIWITTSGTDALGASINYGTGTITGNFGKIFANGGDGFSGLTAGAGGGFVQIESMTLDPQAEVFVEAKGGNGYISGFPGRVKMPKRDLILEGNTMRNRLELIGRDDPYIYEDVTIKSGGELVISGNPLGGTGNGLGVTIQADTFTIETGGMVKSGLGFTAGLGPGQFNNYSGGYSQGGYCTTCSSSMVGSAIGNTGLYQGSSMFGTGAPMINESTWAWVPPPAPMSAASFTNTGYLGLGAAGPKSSFGLGGAGGASMKLVVLGATAINGSINMDGEPSKAQQAGGGAGGSVTIAAPTLTGTGEITARGGNGINLKSPAGAGGFIHLKDVTNLNFEGSVRVDGGSGTDGGTNGSPGVVILPADHNLTVKSGKTWVLGAKTYDLASLTIDNGGTLKTGTDQSSAYGSGVIFNVTGNVTINGTLSGVGMGFTPSGGAGAGPYNGTTFTAGPGGCNGGCGGGSTNGETTASTYGDAYAPLYPGSGGGYFYGGGYGGGSVKIVTPGMLTVNGAIDYSGGAAAEHYTGAGNIGGGGAGGSIWLDVGTFAGSGNIFAKGGNGSATGGGGGGGRIALSYLTKTFTGPLLSANVGGASSFDPGDAGTLVENTPPSVSSLGPSTLVSGSYTSDNTPTFTFTLSDSDTPTQTVKARIQIDDSSDFSSAIVDYDTVLQTQGGSSFTVGQAAGSGTYNTGSASTTLSDSTVGYYWRVLPADQHGKSASSWTSANSGAVAFKVNTVAATATLTNSSGTEQSSYTVGSDSIYASVNDLDQNSSSSTAQTVTVTITDSVSSDSESLTLTETGNDTGIFRNSSGLTNALYDGSASTNDSLFETTGSSTITVTYDDSGTNRTDTATATIASSTATVTLVNTSSGTTAESIFSIAAEDIFVRVQDTDQNTNGGTVQSLSVTVSGQSSAINDSVTLTLAETGANTGIFVNSSALATAIGVAADLPATTLFVKDSETITASYTDGVTSRTTTATMAIAYSDATIKFSNSDGSAQPSTYQIASDSLYVKVTDSDKNLDGSAAETVSATLSNSTTGDSLTLTLTETGANTGIFINLTGVSSALASANSNDSTLQTSGGETVTASYTDATNVSPGASASRTTTVTMSTSSAGETAQLVNSSGSDSIAYLIGTDSAYLKVTDSDENGNPTAEETISVTLSNPATGYSVSGTGDSMTLSLTETGVNTGIFEYESAGSVTGIALELGSANSSDSKLQVVDSSTIELSYTDEDTSSTTKDTAQVSTTVVTSITILGNSSGVEINTYNIGEGIYVQVADSDENTNPGSAQSISITITDSKKNDEEIITLLETGSSTGVFRNVSGLTVALATENPSNSNGSLETEVGATVTATYEDNDSTDDTSTDTATVTIASTTSSTSFTSSSGTEATSYTTTTDSVYITVTDVDENASGTSQESITVTVSSSLAKDSESVTLKETQNNSGIFRNITGIKTKVASSGSANDGNIQVSSKGDTLTAKYTDDDDSSDITSATATIGAVSFRVKTSTSSLVAGTSFTVTIEAIDGSSGSGSTLSSYDGTVNLKISYVDPSSGSDTLTPSSTANFNQGVATLPVTFPNTGVVSVIATDSLDSQMTGASGQLTFYPHSFKVVPATTLQAVSEPFMLTVSALNAQGNVTSNYNGSVQLTHKNISPETQVGSLTPATVLPPAFANGVATIEEVKFDKWGTVTITAADISYASATGTSENISFIPKTLKVQVSPAPSSRSFYYTKEEFDITVQALDHDNALISNYGGTVEFPPSNAAIVTPVSYTFNPSGDGGSYLFTGFADREGKFDVLVQDPILSSLLGKSSDLLIKYAQIVVEDGRAPVGSTLVQVKVVDGAGNLITEENAMNVSVALLESEPNDSASSSATQTTVQIARGQAQLLVADTEPEIVYVSPDSRPVLDPRVGEVTFGVLGKKVDIEYWIEDKSSVR